MSDITFNRQCIWWHWHQMQIRFDIKINNLSASYADNSIIFICTIFLTSSKNRWSISNIFIWSNFFKTMHQSSTIRSDHFYIVTHATAKNLFNVSANDHFNVSINDHFERSFHAVKMNQNLISFHFIYDQFLNFSIHFSFFFKFSDQDTAKWSLICFR